jgi:hypothetical protein
VQTVLLPVTHVCRVGVESVPVVQDPHTIGARSPVNSASLPADSQSSNDKLNENRVGGATEVSPVVPNLVSEHLSASVVESGPEISAVRTAQ